MQYLFFFIRRFALKALFFLLLFFLFRFSLHLLQFSYFQTENWKVIVKSYLHGIRFDLAIIFLSLGIVWWLEYLLTRKAWKKSVNRLVLSFEVLFLIVFCTVYISNMIFFWVFHLHLKKAFIQETLANFYVIPRLLTGVYLAYFVLALAVIILVALLYGYLFYIRKPLLPVFASAKSYTIGACALLFLFLFLARGGWQADPYVWKQLSFRNTEKGAQLTANPMIGLYAIFFKTKENARLQFMADDEAIEQLKIMLAQKGVSFPSGNFFPVFRHFDVGKPVKKYNVLILSLESIAAGDLTFNNPRSPVPTPNMDAIAKQGLYFKNFFSNGFYTKHAYAALLQGFPTLIDQDLYGGEYAERNFGNAFLPLRQAGYDIFAVQPYDINASNLGSNLGALGARVYSEVDFPKRPNLLNQIGVKDQYIFPFLLEKINEAREPFWAVIQTTSTHIPWDLSDPKWETYGVESYEAKKKNALAYLDYQLGQFMKSFRTLPAFKNTILIIYGDHTVVEKNPYAKAHIPLMIVMPDKSLQGISETYGMQTDLFPTIYDLLGIDATTAAFGSSLFRKKPEQEFAIYSTLNENFWIEKGKLLIMKQDKIVAYYDLLKDPDNQTNLFPSTEPDSAILNHYKAYVQSANNLLVDDRLAPFVPRDKRFKLKF